MYRHFLSFLAWLFVFAASTHLFPQSTHPAHQPQAAQFRIGVFGGISHALYDEVLPDITPWGATEVRTAIKGYSTAMFGATLEFVPAGAEGSRLWYYGLRSAYSATDFRPTQRDKSYARYTAVVGNPDSLRNTSLRHSRDLQYAAVDFSVYIGCMDSYTGMSVAAGLGIALLTGQRHMQSLLTLLEPAGARWAENPAFIYTEDMRSIILEDYNAGSFNTLYPYVHLALRYHLELGFATLSPEAGAQLPLGNILDEPKVRATRFNAGVHLLVYL